MEQLDVHPKCCGNKLCQFVCLDKKCDKNNPFICKSDCADKLCEANHLNCKKYKWEAFKQILFDSRSFGDDQLMLVIEKVEQLLKQSIKELELEKAFFNKWKKNFGLSAKVIAFIQNLKQSNQNKMKGRELRTIADQVENNTKITFQTMKEETIKISAQIKYLRALIRGVYQPSQKLPIIKLEQKNPQRINFYPEEYKPMKSPQFRPEKTKYQINQANIQMLPQVQPLIFIKQINLKKVNALLKSLNVMPLYLQIRFVRFYFNKIEYLLMQLNKKQTCFIDLVFQNNQSDLEIAQLAQTDRVKNKVKHQEVDIQIIIQITEFSTILMNTKNLKKLKRLDLYWIWPLENDKFEKMICTSILQLPALKQFYLITNRIQQQGAFAKLGDKFKPVIKNWQVGERWGL